MDAGNAGFHLNAQTLDKITQAQENLQIGSKADLQENPITSKVNDSSKEPMAEIGNSVVYGGKNKFIGAKIGNHNDTHNAEILETSSKIGDLIEDYDFQSGDVNKSNLYSSDEVPDSSVSELDIENFDFGDSDLVGSDMEKRIGKESNIVNEGNSAIEDLQREVRASIDKYDSFKNSVEKFVLAKLVGNEVVEQEVSYSDLNNLQELMFVSEEGEVFASEDLKDKLSGGGPLSIRCLDGSIKHIPINTINFIDSTKFQSYLVLYKEKMQERRDALKKEDKSEQKEINGFRNQRVNEKDNHPKNHVKVKDTLGKGKRVQDEQRIDQEKKAQQDSFIKSEEDLKSFLKIKREQFNKIKEKNDASDLKEFLINQEKEMSEVLNQVSKNSADPAYQMITKEIKEVIYIITNMKNDLLEGKSSAANLTDLESKSLKIYKFLVQNAGVDFALNHKIKVAK